MRHYARREKAGEKKDGSVVTRADKEAEQVLLRALHSLAVPILSEEAAGMGKIPPIRRRFWLVDALDGTREFVSRNGEFSVNAALVEGGRPVLGIVYLPALGRLFAGWGRGEAYHWQPRFIGGKGWMLGTAKVLRGRSSQRRLLVMSRSHAMHGREEMAARYDAKGVKVAGSSLKFCLLAAGEADIYPREGPTMNWDTAAGHAVLLSAGGRVETQDGKPLAYGPYAQTSETDLFRNPPFLALSR